MKAIVIGFGSSGRSAAQFLVSKGFDVIAFDRNVDSLLKNPEVTAILKNGITLFSDSSLLPHDRIGVAVLSPGVPSQHPLVLQLKEKGVGVISEIELAFQFPHPPFLGITGTNGKTTVTLMTSHILNGLGVNASAMGNSGIPLTSIESSRIPLDVVALELSSYQLETTTTQALNAGVILNITPDHLDRYSAMEEYAEAKLRLFSLVKKGGEKWIHESVIPFIKKSSLRETFANGEIFVYGEGEKCKLRRVGNEVLFEEKVAFILPEKYQSYFRHDIENIMASYLLCRQFCPEGMAFSEILTTFKKPKHRLEFVQTVNGIDFYNDSKGTNIDAVVRAVESLGRPIVLIAGEWIKIPVTSRGFQLFKVR